MEKIFLGSDGKPLAAPEGETGLSKMQAFYGARDEIVAKLPGAFLAPDKRPDCKAPITLVQNSTGRVIRTSARPGAERIVLGTHRMATADESAKLDADTEKALKEANLRRAASELKVVVAPAPSAPDVMIPQGVELTKKVSEVSGRK